MGTTARQIDVHIEKTREALGANLDELEQKVKAVTDWRHHFRTKPILLLGIAFGGGLLLSAMFGGRRSRSDSPLFSQTSADAAPGAESARREEAVARQTWDNVKGAIIAVATTRLLNYAGETFLGFNRKSPQTRKTDRVISPQ